MKSEKNFPEYREAEISELDTLYNEFLLHYFIDDERKPLSMIKYQYKKHHYRIVVQEFGGVVIGAAFLTYYTSDAILLDYFAVKSDFRGKGYGSLLFKYVSDTYCRKIPLLIETETLAEEVEDVERKVRLRRNEFYSKNNAVKTSSKVKIWSCIYDIWYVSSENMPEDRVIYLYDGIYRKMIPHIMYRRNCIIPYK